MNLFLKTAIFVLIATTGLLNASEEMTFSMIKPSAVREEHTGAILNKIESSGLRIAALKMHKMTKEQAEEFYKEHKDRPFYQELVAFMTTGPVVAMVVEGENSVSRLRAIVGATNPAKAEAGTIRALFGKSITENAIHASDSQASSAREIPFFFQPSEIYSR
jgi:nucleoside-diphosphate kinase